MRVYKWMYIVGTCCVSILCANYSYYGVLNHSIVWAIVPALFIFLWWFGVYRLFKGSVAISLLAPGLVSGLVLVQLLRRLIFIFANHSMEGPNGEGSPLLFLVNMVFELFIFFCFFITFIQGFNAYSAIKNEQNETHS